MPKKSKERIEQEIEEGELEEDLYTEEGRGVAEDEDEITNVEEGFMEGYDEDELAAKCANCKKILADEYFEEEFSEGLLKFCSDICVRKYEKKHK